MPLPAVAHNAQLGSAEEARLSAVTRVSKTQQGAVPGPLLWPWLLYLAGDPGCHHSEPQFPHLPSQLVFLYSKNKLRASVPAAIRAVGCGVEEAWLLSGARPWSRRWLCQAETLVLPVSQLSPPSVFRPSCCPPELSPELVLLGPPTPWQAVGSRLPPPRFRPEVGQQPLPTGWDGNSYSRVTYLSLCGPRSRNRAVGLGTLVCMHVCVHVSVFASLCTCVHMCGVGAHMYMCDCVAHPCS